jgi:tetratricopeptide (TPR) repeat protein
MTSPSQRVLQPEAAAADEPIELAVTVDATISASVISIDAWPLHHTGPVPAVCRKIAGRYELGGHLGSGGFGSVYEAHDPICDRAVAVKLLGAQSERELERFRYETTSLRLLQVPGVVRLLDDGIDQGEAFIVMERVTGRYFPGPRIPVTWEQLARPTITLLEALAPVHALGVVHRDLKPSNVLVDAEGRVTILDFGVSVLRDVTPEDGSVVGTPAYLSPEQATGAAVDLRADIYAIGVMLFEALSGRLPHDGKTPREVMQEKTERRAPSLAAVAPSVPADIAGIVDWMLEPRPAERPSTVDEVIDALLGREAADPIAQRVEELAQGRPLTVETLRRVFAGPDVFVHIPTDAAELVLSRAGDSAEAVAHELGAWVRAGLARCEHGTIALDRTALHRITALPVRRRAVAAPKALNAAERDLLVWITLGGPTVSAPVLARAGDYPPNRFAELLAGLSELGVVRPSGRGGYSADAGAAAAWPAPRIRAAHRALFTALAPGDPVRMQQAILASDPSLIISELDPFVAAAIRDGRVEAARALMSEALRVMRRDPDHTAQGKALVAMAELALTEATLPAYDHLLVEIGCMPRQTLMVDRLRKLAKGAQLSELQDVDRALTMLDDAGEFGSAVLELRRRAAKARAVRTRLGPLLQVIADSRDWAAAAPPPAQAHLKAWEGRAEYRRGRFAQSAMRFLLAASSMESASARVLERLNAAGALLETYDDLDDLVTLAGRIRAEAAELRDPLAEARAAWVERAARYRRGEDLEPDFGLVDAARGIGTPWQTALLVFQEAAFAWRRNLDSSRPYFKLLADLDPHQTTAEPLLLMARMLGDGTDADRHRLAVDAAMETAQRQAASPGLALQLVALAVTSEPGAVTTARHVLGWAEQAIPEQVRHKRRELLSIDECARIILSGGEALFIRG